MLRSPALAAIAAVTCAALLAVAWLVPVAPGPAGDLAVPPRREAPSVPVVPPLSDLKETTARPLLSPTRRPVPGAAAEAAPGTAAALFNRYRLQGVVIDGNRRRVLLAPAPGGRTLSIGEGESVDGWTIDRIAPERLTLRSGDRTETVELGTIQHR
ncbi:hypothetical protein [Desertibaculum subflavum]|uniref:hypothetical protein n=1 Tax=Desertibaculum subflavum TaxID=2268458 RepID=UPI0013C49B50